MTERIDHVAEALGLLEFERHESELGFETADAQHLANYLEAKVHATLALAEQQRIANLIALKKDTTHDWIVEEEKYGKLGQLSRQVVTGRSLSSEIKEALGL